MNKLSLFLLIGILLISSVMADVFSESDISRFQNTLTGWSCTKNISSSYWLNSDNNNRINVMLEGVMAPFGNCSLYSGDVKSTCCPLDKPYCLSEGICSAGGEFCANYNTTLSCNGANSGESKVAQNSVNNGSNICGKKGYSPIYKLLNDITYGPSSDCFNYTNCACAWVNSECIARATPTKYCQNATGGFDEEYDGYCTWTTPSVAGSLNCDVSGVITYASKANWTGDANSVSLAKVSCLDITRSYACPETAKLPFFSMFNLLVSLAMIGIIYFFTRKN